MAISTGRHTSDRRRRFLGRAFTPALGLDFHSNLGAWRIAVTLTLQWAHDEDHIGLDQPLLGLLRVPLHSNRILKCDAHSPLLCLQVLDVLVHLVEQLLSHLSRLLLA